MSRRSVMTRQGFTLVESVATIVVLAVLGSLASFILIPLVSSASDATAAAQLHMELSMGLDRIGRELRSIQQAPEKEGPVPDISQISETAITWHTSRRLLLVNDQIRLIDEGGVTHVLLENVSEFSILAFDESNNPLGPNLDEAQCDLVQRLQISISASRQNVSQAVRTKVFIRSIMQTEES